jgi:hypothetical protein
MSVAVGSLIGMRTLPAELGAFGYILSLCGLAWSIDLALAARRRHVEGDALVRADRPGLDAGPAVARTATVAGAFGIAALALVAVLALR